MDIDIDLLTGIAVKAGEAIMSVYNDDRDASVTYKADSSPLTLADKLSHKRIVADLTLHYPEIPILSEEGAHIPYEVRSEWEYYWCVDPLDGTKEFINRNGEFTVNIALIHRDTPVLGVIYVPCKNVLYYGDSKGSYRQKLIEGKVRIKTESKPSNWTAVGSRSHADGTEADFLSAYPVTRQLSAGSSLKFCLVAEGKAQIYFRSGPTMEWDTAAGHAIAVNSGAIMQGVNGEPFRYNKPSLLNPGFVCRVELPQQ
ncbi:3'(2'),5'-bisphosphate nucleotidase CysQ [Mucilaginibacter sp. JRF]|uniref:3'(2'),5'-bisphosphate nucleotidase CysQ n=1 Tax=Mucilaginibacter sp. JRF TaxID=2780088 RepID=UPI0018816AD5|nr:3'(2'),5'-bisphosphate nucleotidase CysQ [Mucilaginibacter sp. JRF]MBE9585903.1 3'(2'),5'-bisphosphate nucleotidase CysQ [Mucilaginibacter sp. JRF]